MTLITSQIDVIQGDSVALAYGTSPAQDMTDWVARVQVRAQPDEPELIDIVLTGLNPEATQITGLMLTDTIPAGEFILGAQLSNPNTGESKEIHSKLTVRAQIVY
jgi:hypothetical protein